MCHSMHFALKTIELRNCYKPHTKKQDILLRGPANDNPQRCQNLSAIIQNNKQ